MGQSPATTLMNLLQVGRDLGLARALLPPEVVRTVHAARGALTDDSRITDAALRERNVPTRYPFAIAGVLSAGQGSNRDSVERSGTLIRLRASVVTAPTTTTCIAELRNGNGDTLATVTIPIGATTAESATNVALTAGTWLYAVVTQAGGAADLSVIASERMD